MEILGFERGKSWPRTLRPGPWLVDRPKGAVYRSSVVREDQGMKVLVVGGGGREHALVWKLRQSPRVAKIWCAPGNGGIAADAESVELDAGDVAGLVAFAEKDVPDLTVVGPELPLVNGIADAFHARNWAIVGPSKHAAQLEGSKIFAKQFLRRHGIPTARMLETFESAEQAVSALRNAAWPMVLKADGLCSGKGVLVAQNFEEACDFLERAMVKNELGAGGKRIFVEEALEGEELSFILVTDGKSYAPLVPTRDHKRVFDGNRGPNTGGMGAYSTDALLPEPLREKLVATVVEPTLRGLAYDGIPYQGFLYIGVMLTNTGPKVLEFNCRLGDPETQAIVARMDFDLAEVLADVAAGSLSPSKLHWKNGASACLVLASGGYPGKFEVGRPIEGLTTAEHITGVKVLHAGTKRKGEVIVTSGGRVLGVTAAAPSLEGALQLVYEAAGKIRFEGMHYRRDIGRQMDSLKAAGN
jgi:phosphoribosylamine--glycine ligase